MPNLKQVTIVGLGVNEFIGLTLEGKHALEKAARIGYLGQSDFAKTRLLHINCKVDDLRELYTDGHSKEVYSSIATRVIELAAQENSYAFAVNGNPSFLNSIVANIESEVLARGWTFRLVQAQSSLDHILGLCKICPTSAPVHVTTEQKLICSEEKLDCSSTNLIFQLGTPDRGELKKSKGSNSSNFQKLVQKVSATFDKDQNWEFVCLANTPNQSHKIIKGKIQELGALYKLNRTGTLVIRPRECR